MLESTEIRNNIMNIRLPLVIFIRMQSQESQSHNKCLICSIMSINCVQVATFFRDQVYKSKHSCRSGINFKKLYYRSKKHVKLSTESIFSLLLSQIFNNVPTGEFLCLQRSHGTQVARDTWLIQLPFSPTSQQKPHSSF